MNGESVPFLVHESALSSWPCVRWSLQDWANKCQDIKLTFRVHKRNGQNQISWENDAHSYVKASIQQLVDHVKHSHLSSDSNPFTPFPTEQYCYYSGYNHMNQVFDQENHKELFESVKWCEIQLDEPKLQNDARNSTLWIGTSGAYTPCHMDTYGYNLVAQLHGK